MIAWWWLIGAFIVGVFFGVNTFWFLNRLEIQGPIPSTDETDAYAIFNEVLEDD